ncbi:MAG: ABC transporter substrate-binding protein, partial [Acidimicrobiales bacterium]
KLLAVLLAGALMAAACGSDDTSESSDGDAGSEDAGGGGESTDVTLTLQWVTQAQFAGYYAALDQGFYEEEGLNVTIQPGGPDINPIQLLISGDTDIAIQQFGTVLTSREEGADVVSMGQVFERGAYRLAYFDDAGITSSADFEGKVIGLWGGFQPQVSATFGKNGLDIDSDAEVFNQGFDMLAFLDGTLDLASAMTYNEYAQALAGNEGDAEILLFNPNEEGTATLEDTLTTTETWLEANPEAAEGFIRATARGWIYCRDNPEACVEIVLANGTALPEDFQTWQMNEVNKLIWPSENGILNLTDGMFDQTAGILFEVGVIETEATSDAYDTSFRDKAVSELSDEDIFGNDFTPQDLDPNELFGG